MFNLLSPPLTPPPLNLPTHLFTPLQALQGLATFAIHEKIPVNPPLPPLILPQPTIIPPLNPPSYNLSPLYPFTGSSRLSYICYSRKNPCQPTLTTSNTPSTHIHTPSNLSTHPFTPLQALQGLAAFATHEKIPVKCCITVWNMCAGSEERKSKVR